MAAVFCVLVTAGGEWDPRVDPACCAYPERDPRDYNWPYSHLLYAEVVPDVVGAFVAMTDLELAFRGSSGTRHVMYGEHIQPAALASAPDVRFGLDFERDSSSLHALIAVDPDVPFRDSPVERERVLWLVHDIPRNETAAGKLLWPYTPPVPLACDEADELCLPEHRVTFLLFEQHDGPLRLEPEDEAARAPDARREGFKARDFAVRHGLGLPLAVNFLETAAVGQRPGGVRAKEEL